MANTRRSSVARAFIDALTRGGPGGTPRPIELQAHDPIRYIGDMLAWVHQAAASEREILEGLFDVEEQRLHLSMSTTTFHLIQDIALTDHK